MNYKHSILLSCIFVSALYSMEDGDVRHVDQAIRVEQRAQDAYLLQGSAAGAGVLAVMLVPQSLPWISIAHQCIVSQSYSFGIAPACVDAALPLVPHVILGSIMSYNFVKAYRSEKKIGQLKKQLICKHK
ncbi:MAG: hypothetical protein WC707_05960 [Candidatus Babeliaceae bacterium]